MSDEAPTSAANPRPAALLMYATYVVGAAGVFIGFGSVAHDPPTLSWAAFLAVGLGGILSWVRHSLFHASDAARLGWDLGRRNNFQIEVGLANLAWGLLAVCAVVFQWGLAAQAASFLVFGFYLVAVSLMLVGTKGRSWGPTIGMATFGIMLTIIGVLGMQAA